VAAITNVFRRGWTDDGGAELLELAIALPILMLIVGGVIDFAILFQRYEVVTNAAREGARIAILPSYDAYDIRVRVNNYLVEGGVPVAANNATANTNPVVNVYDVTVPLGGSPPTLVDAYQVSVTYFHNYLFLGGLSGLFGGSFSSVPLKGVSTMRIEGSGS